MNLDFLLTWAVLSVSFYNSISLLWLGVMVLLSGNRRAAGTWLTGGGLLLGALFFTSHTAILGSGLANTGFGMNFWWWVSWAPAAAAPLAWYGSLLWYAGFSLRRPHPHRLWLGLVSGLLVLVVFLLVFANPLPNYHYVAGRVIVVTPSIGGVPLLILVYLVYSLLCYLLPLDLLRLSAKTTSPLVERARHLARPWLAAASLALLLAGGLLVWTALWALETTPAVSLAHLLVERTVMEFDLAVATLVAVAITLLGRAIVAFEVFTGRTLPRNRFFYQWRSTVILAAGFGVLAAWTLAIELRPLYSLMLATALMTLFYALYAWRSYSERDQFMSRLRPFVASQNLYGQLTGEDAAGFSSTAQELLDTLCRDILGVSTAALVPTGALAALAGPPLAYPRGHPSIAFPSSDWSARFTPKVRCLPAQGIAGAAWMVPLWGAHGLAGTLLLGEKSGGSVFTEEEIELAQAAGERLLDTLAGSEMARLSMDLLRQRLSQARLLEGQGRRVLHDEVLPELHTAILYLSGQAPSAELEQAIDTLSAAHRRISDLMRASGPSTPQRLAQEGLTAALQALVAADYSADFDRVEWAIAPGAAAKVGSLPLYVSEVIYYAVRELVRNASRYGRGPERRPDLRLKIEIQQRGDTPRLIVEDNGVGIESSLGGNDGAGSGLRIHSAMLAAVGGGLEVSQRSHGGTRGVISIKIP